MDNVVVDLHFLELLCVSGEDSEKFLQGQLTCDLEHLKPGQTTVGAACNNKGRVFADFRISRIGVDYYLSMQPGMQALFTGQLKKYIPFYKANMSDAGNRFKRLGVIGRQAAEHLAQWAPQLPDPGHITAVADAYLLNSSFADLPRYEIWLPAGAVAPSWDLPEADAGRWRLADVEHGYFSLTPGDAEMYTPEELNYDLNGHVSFSKGCYTGQEIVARMHYRGKAKKRLYQARFESDGPPTDPSLLDDQENTLGKLSNILNINDNNYISLVVMSTGVNPDTALWVRHGDDRSAVTLKPLDTATSPPD